MKQIVTLTWIILTGGRKNMAAAVIKWSTWPWPAYYDIFYILMYNGIIFNIYSGQEKHDSTDAIKKKPLTDARFNLTLMLKI